MRATVMWLSSIEDRAARLFERLAGHFRDDAALAGLLERLSEDELTHRQIMANILATAKGDLVPFFAIKDRSKTGVEKAFSAFEKAVRERKVTRENVFDHILDVESSEFNSICLHVVNTLKHCDRSFRPEAAKLSRHKASIDRFIRSNAGFERYAGRIEALPDVWREKILVVDDDASAAGAIKAAVESEGSADTAANAGEALRMIGERYYAAILVDVEMPVMGGIELAELAAKIFPGIKGRMLFLAGASDERSQDLLIMKNLKFLTRPDGIAQIRKAVSDMLDSL